MKKLLVIILSIALLVASLIGCSGRGGAIGEKPELNFETTATPKPSEPAKADEKNSDNKINDEDKPEVEIEDSSETMRILLLRSKWDALTEEDVDLWEQYINDKYDFSIELVIVSMADEGWFGLDVNNIKENSSQGGFIYISNLTQLNELIDSGLIEPVNSHIKQVGRYNTLSDEILKRFSDSNDKIWSFPLTDRTYQGSSIRYYSKGYLERAELDTPKTVEEFYEYAMFVAQNNEEGNSKNNVYVGEYADYSWLIDFDDIFKAFGCYSFGQSPLAYNPQKEKYEICIFNENFNDAISYIKLLNDEGAFFNRRPTEISGVSQGLTLESHQVAATTRLSSDYSFDGGISIGNYLTGINTEFIVENRTGSNCFAVLRGTKEVPKKLNDFFNMLLKYVT